MFLDAFYGSAQTYTFSSIPQDYGRLIIRGGLNMQSGYSGQLGIRFNGDTGTNYYTHTSLVRADTQALSEAATLDTQFNPIGNGSIDGNNTYIFEIEITNYKSTTLRKSVSILLTNTSTGSSYTGIQIADGTWNNTAAITSITLFNRQNSNTFAGWPWSHAYLYGLKEA